MHNINEVWDATARSTADGADSRERKEVNWLIRIHPRFSTFFDCRPRAHQLTALQFGGIGDFLRR
jgi:hypothetical protein